MKTYPQEWEPRPTDTKAGWKNNAKVLSEIVTALNSERYIEDENEMMEYMDIVLDILKSKYNIQPLPLG